MGKRILTTLSFIYCIFSTLFSQGLIYSDNSVNEDDSVIIFTEEFRGDIIWQRSFDLITWDSITDARQDSLKMIADTSSYFRAKITEGTCKPIFSDTIYLIVAEAGDQAFNPELTYDSITDIDGNTYKTIQIGDQEWMAQNLATTHYNDGTAIPLVTDDSEWRELSTPAYCWYNNDESTKKNTYGALYNWYTVETGRLCPSGWHVPADEEWKQLEMHLGMSQSEVDSEGFRGTNEGGKLKETGATHWNISPSTATNESGFTALPGGLRDAGGFFQHLGSEGDWWSSSEYSHSATSAWHRTLYSNLSDVYRGYWRKKEGHSVRCVRDQ